ncbi:MAG: hypothetical protein AAF412_10050 [Pseudomonadota bacterium]
MTQSPKHFMRRVRNIHFTGIGGAGMSGIAMTNGRQNAASTAAVPSRLASCLGLRFNMIRPRFLGRIDFD